MLVCEHVYRCEQSEIQRRAVLYCGLHLRHDSQGANGLVHATAPRQSLIFAEIARKDREPWFAYREDYELQGD